MGVERERPGRRLEREGEREREMGVERERPGRRRHLSSGLSHVVYIYIRARWWACDPLGRSVGNAV
jgi:hypothetical protein